MGVENQDVNGEREKAKLQNYRNFSGTFWLIISSKVSLLFFKIAFVIDRETLIRKGRSKIFAELVLLRTLFIGIFKFYNFGEKVRKRQNCTRSNVWCSKIECSGTKQNVPINRKDVTTFGIISALLKLGLAKGRVDICKYIRINTLMETLLLKNRILSKKNKIFVKHIYSVYKPICYFLRNWRLINKLGKHPLLLREKKAFTNRKLRWKVEIFRRFSANKVFCSYIKILVEHQNFGQHFLQINP